VHTQRRLRGKAIASVMLAFRAVSRSRSGDIQMLVTAGKHGLASGSSTWLLVGER
jgi:hypothetical protein